MNASALPLDPGARIGPNAITGGAEGLLPRRGAGATAGIFERAGLQAYLADPQSVEPRWRGYFDELQKLDEGQRNACEGNLQFHG